MSLDTDKYIRADHSDKQRQDIEAFAGKLPEASDEMFLTLTERMIWLSAYAANNPKSAYHAMADLCHDEAARRGKPELYTQAHEQASQQ